ncbi:MAG: hypothetical protein WC374_13040 [Phycisphaerae bacterium]|jgi:hypothetical protein
MMDNDFVIKQELGDKPTADQVRWRIEDIMRARSLLCNSGFAYAASVVGQARYMRNNQRYLQGALDEIAEMETKRAAYDAELERLFKLQDKIKEVTK